MLTHPNILGWDVNDLAAQATIAVPQQTLESHVFRDSEPKSRRPDILVTSSLFDSAAFVVEEKKKQNNVKALNEHRIQLIEYQSLYECVWGLLTDGEKWILKKGFETHHEFESLDELKSSLKDIQNCIGKNSLLQRKLIHGTYDLVLVVPSGAIHAQAYSSLSELILLRDSMRAHWSTKSDSVRRNEFIRTYPSSRTGGTSPDYAMYRARFRVEGNISHNIWYKTKTSHIPAWHWPDGSSSKGFNVEYNGAPGIASVDLVYWADLRTCTIGNYLLFD